MIALVVIYLCDCPSGILLIIFLVMFDQKVKVTNKKFLHVLGKQKARKN